MQERRAGCSGTAAQRSAAGSGRGAGAYGESNFAAALALLDPAVSRQEAAGSPLLLASTLLLGSPLPASTWASMNGHRAPARAAPLFTAGGDSLGRWTRWRRAEPFTAGGDPGQSSVGRRADPPPILMDAENDTPTAVTAGPPRQPALPSAASCPGQGAGGGRTAPRPPSRQPRGDRPGAGEPGPHRLFKR